MLLKVLTIESSYFFNTAYTTLQYYFYPYLFVCYEYARIMMKLIFTCRLPRGITSSQSLLKTSPSLGRTFNFPASIRSSQANSVCHGEKTIS